MAAQQPFSIKLISIFLDTLEQEGHHLFLQKVSDFTMLLGVLIKVIE